VRSWDQLALASGARRRDERARLHRPHLACQPRCRTGPGDKLSHAGAADHVTVEREISFKLKGNSKLTAQDAGAVYGCGESDRGLCWYDSSPTDKHCPSERVSASWPPIVRPV